jgi:hypothetical protein
VLVAAFAAALGALAPAAAAGKAPKPGTVVERPVRSLAPDADVVKESFVRVYKPLPARYGPHPKACDWIGSLRFRSSDGPREASDADAVLVIIPGFLGGAASFEQLARNTVRDAAARGKHVEYWSIDRRSNCLEDDRGVHAAAKARNPKIAYDYYWGDRRVRGKSFPGWVSEEDAAWLDHVGLAQTMRDWYAVMKAAVPSQKARARKVFCGGHSMGGPLTAAFASWDFDNKRKTKRDAGFRQCRGFVGLDTTLRLALPGGGTPSPSSVLLTSVIASGSPYVNTPPIVPETIQLPPIFGVGAFFHPQSPQLLRDLPQTMNIDLAQRFLFSRDAAHFALGFPSIRDFTVTNEGTLAGVFDDNSAPLFFLRTSLGILGGGPLTDKNFPQPDPTLALPEDPDVPLYSWQGYRWVGAKGRAIPLNDDGDPYTSRESEVTDVHQFARTIYEAPADFIEQYFPVRLLKDLRDAGNGDRSGSLSHLKYDGLKKRPAIVIDAGDSQDNTNPDRGRPTRGKPPNSRPLSRLIIIPGYNHLDVVTAARAQNDGRPEPSALSLAKFALQAIARR